MTETAPGGPAHVAPYDRAKRIRVEVRGILDNYDAALHGAKAPDDCDVHASSGDNLDPASIDAIDARANAHQSLTYYARVILDEVNDGTIQTCVDASNVYALGRFVDRWALALSEQMPGTAIICNSELGKCHNRLRSIANGERSQRIQVGKCPEVDYDDAAEDFISCTGGLWAVLRVTDSVLPKAVTCDLNVSHVWEPARWHELGQWLGRPSQEAV